MTTNLSLDKVFKQVAQDQADLPAAVAAIQDAGTDEALQNAAAVSDLLGQTVTSLPASTQILDIVTGVAATATSAAADATTTAAASASASATGSSKKNGNGRGNNNNNNSNAANSGNNRGNNKKRAEVFFA